ncbi:MAG: hypothetical protein U0625_10420 [Phycisphaerales bacterium]
MTSCEVCRIHDAAAPGYAQRFAPLEAWRGPRWIVRHHLHPAPLVGWTFLCAARHVQGPADFNDAEAAGFGRALRTASQAVRALTGCDRVYAIAFGQGAPHLHVHLIPRFDAHEPTRAWAVADWYRAVERGEVPAADPAAVADFVARLRAHFGTHPPE